MSLLGRVNADRVYAEAIYVLYAAFHREIRRAHGAWLVTEIEHNEMQIVALLAVNGIFFLFIPVSEKFIFWSVDVFLQAVS